MSPINNSEDHFSSQNNILSFIYHLTFLIDIYANFICATLMFSLFNEQYQCLCKCIDIRFNVFCNQYIAQKVQAAMKLENSLGETMSNNSYTSNRTSTATTSTQTNTGHAQHNPITNIGQFTNTFNNE